MREWVIVLAAGCGRIGFDDIAMVDGAIDAAPAPPCPPLPGVIFCESFEDGALLATTAGTVDVDETRAFRGQRSQYATTSMGASWQLGGVLPFITSGDLYARWYLYIPSSVTTGLDLASVHLVEDTLPFNGLIYGLAAGTAEVSSSEANVTATSSLVVPRDRWFCAQMHVLIANDAGAIDGAVDGQPIAALTDLDTLPANGYRNVHAGLFATGPSMGTLELWTDELAVGTEPIPCD